MGGENAAGDMPTSSDSDVGTTSPTASRAPKLGELPGTATRRYLPRFHWELLVCGLRGHELVGTDAASLRPQDAAIAREINGERWYRCLRCDSWLPLAPPAAPRREMIPVRDEIDLPRRGKALRDRIVLRLIAIDRLFHFVVLGLLGTAILLFAHDRTSLRHRYYQFLAHWQAAAGGPVSNHHIGVFHELDRLFSFSTRDLYLFATGVLAYALLEGVEGVGLWWQKRWAEYLTFLATLIFLPVEIYELTERVTWLRVAALVINLAIVCYLLYAKRLFGVRGGAAADEAARERDSGWAAIDVTTPP
jgi:uncharacterized membrane protein (DUF2068 family)